MSERKISFVEHEYYHIYNRGNNKQIIFKDGFDYARFQMSLYVANGTKPFVFREVKKSSVFDFERGEQLVHIGAYCLMPNHFHILLTPAVEHGVQTFMQKLSTGYSMYFNKRYERTGGLYEGRFKSQHVDSDEYLKYLFSYIHLNPIKLIQSDWKERGIHDKVRALTYLDTYSFSSFKDYNDVDRKDKAIINRSIFQQFNTSEELQSEIFDWLQFRENL